MDFIYFNLDLSLVAYLKGICILIKKQREKCVTWVVQNYFSLSS